MTQTDVPERIWVTSDGYYDHVTAEYDGYKASPDETHYTRTDTIQATVGAALAERDATIAKLVEALDRIADLLCKSSTYDEYMIASAALASAKAEGGE